MENVALNVKRRLGRISSRKSSYGGDEMDFSFTEAEEAFRQELRSWLEANLPDGWLEGDRSLPDDEEELEAFLRGWQRRLYEGGWAGIAWPKEYGGRGATLIEQVIYQQEMARVQAPPELNRIGIGMVGPTLIARGTEEQKKKYVPKILNGEEIWCQGYSEPNSGSDLASLQTRAVWDGEVFRITGQKIWTSWAHFADRCFLLARTDSSGSKHEGITAFLVDMRQPGVETRRIHQISGGKEFNQVFFDGAIAYPEDVVGEVNKGWEVAITLLMFERFAAAGRVIEVGNAFQRLVETAKQRRRNGIPLSKDPIVRQRLADYYIRTKAAELTFYRNLTNWIQTGRPGPEGSIDKLYYSELNVDMLGFGLGLLGLESGYWDSTGPVPASAVDDWWQYSWLSSFGLRIAGGTSEIMKNIIAERILGLPKDIKLN